MTTEKNPEDLTKRSVGALEWAAKSGLNESANRSVKLVDRVCYALNLLRSPDLHTMPEADRRRVLEVARTALEEGLVAASGKGR